MTHIKGQRCEMTQSDNYIYKTVGVSKLVGKTSPLELNGYINWIKQYFEIPETSVKHVINNLRFQQELIKENDSYNPIKILDKLMKLKIDKYGLDSNPGNFMFADGKIYFVDFYPLLINKDDFLQDQFVSDVADIKKRYFTKINIVAFFIVRLFRENWQDGMRTLAYCQTYIEDNWDLICKREQMRLNMVDILEVVTTDGDEEKQEKFLKYYEKTKPIKG